MALNILRWFVGLDIGEEEHRACVVGVDGQRLEERCLAHSGAGMLELVAWLMGVSDGRPEEVGVALESPHGAAVDTLLKNGFRAFSINPKQADRFRDRHSPAGSKDDRLDAYVLADALRTDQPLFRPLRPCSPLVIRLRAWLHTESELKQEYRRLANRLRCLLCRFFPELLELSPAADEPWLWALLEKAPSPAVAARLQQTTIQRLLRTHRIRRWNASAVLERLSRTPLPVAPGVVAASEDSIALLIPRLRLVHQQLKHCELKSAQLLAQVPDANASDDEKREHRDLQILLSLPGAGRVIASTMLTEATEALLNRDYHALRAQAGAAPVARSSGKRHRRHNDLVLMRRAYNHRLCCAVFAWVNLAVQRDPKARALYQAHRQRGHSFARSVRAVADRLLAMLIALLHNDCVYDPARRAT